MSGYSDSDASNTRDDELDQQLLQKPFKAESLLRRVRLLLDEQHREIYL